MYHWTFVSRALEMRIKAKALEQSFGFYISFAIENYFLTCKSKLSPIKSNKSKGLFEWNSLNAFQSFYSPEIFYLFYPMQATVFGVVNQPRSCTTWTGYAIYPVSSWINCDSLNLKSWCFFEWYESVCTKLRRWKRMFLN